VKKTQTYCSGLNGRFCSWLIVKKMLACGCTINSDGREKANYLNSLLSALKVALIRSENVGTT